MAETVPAYTGHDPDPARLAEARSDILEWIGAKFRDELDFAPAAERAVAGAETFLALYDERPVRDNQGGSGFNNSLWLYALGRAFRPRLIVESGVWRGHSTWVLRRACPEAELVCCDIDFGNLAHRDADASYHEADWMTVRLPAVDPDTSLAFFDDHVSHARRIMEAHGRGFRLLVLDDDYPPDQLETTGAPPVPTAAMVVEDSLVDGSEIVWHRNGKRRSYTVRADELRAARELIERRIHLPVLMPVKPGSVSPGLTVLKLVP